jgi:hypothetical protein
MAIKWKRKKMDDQKKSVQRVRIVPVVPKSRHFFQHFAIPKGEKAKRDSG